MNGVFPPEHNVFLQLRKLFSKPGLKVCVCVRVRVQISVPLRFPVVELFMSCLCTGILGQMFTRRLKKGIGAIGGSGNILFYLA